MAKSGRRRGGEGEEGAWPGDGMAMDWTGS